jgi:cytochrome P450
MRAEAPAYWLPHGNGGMWMFTRYADVELILKDLRFKKDTSRFVQLGEQNFPQMLNTDPPDHTRLRSLVSKAFTPKVVEGMGPPRWPGRSSSRASR